MKARDPASKGEVWLVLNNLGHPVTDARHLPHETKDECVIEFLLGTPLGDDAELGTDEEPDVFRLAGSHDLWEAISEYALDTRGDDVLVILPHRKKYAIVPRRQLHETDRSTLPSDIGRYIQ